MNLANHFSRGFESSDLTQTIEANVMMPVEIGEISAKMRIRFIHLGSYWQLEHFARNPKFDSLYLQSKILASNLLQQTFQHFEGYTELLVPDTFGLNDHRDKFIPHLTKAKKEGKCVALNDPWAFLNLCSSEGVSKALLGLARGAQFPSKKILLAPSLQISVRGLLRELDVCECDSKVHVGEPLQAPKFQLINDGITTILSNDHYALSHLKSVPSR